jgi:cyclophilin family peptidyl-prolyl cis-trans isomerase
VGKPPSERQKEQRRNERVLAMQEAEARRLRKRRTISIVVVVIIVATLFSLVAGGYLVDDGEDDVSTTGSTGPTSSTILPPTSPAVPPTAPGPTVAITLPATGAAITGETPCPAADGSSERTTSFDSPPPMCIDTAKQYTAILHTSEGDMTFLLNDDQSPETVNNFVVLSRYHFYDGLPFYGIHPGKMVLSGDATGDPELGAGGPGYTFPDEFPDVGTIFPPGSLHSWTDTPDQNGSRFVIATGEQAADLPSMTYIGQMLDGDRVLRAIQDQGDPTTGTPTKEIVIESVEIIEEDE